MKTLDVVKPFRDKETGKRYVVGDVYPVENQDRATFLQQSGYLQRAEIEQSVEDEGLVAVEGGYWLLPDGKKTKSKAKALEALKALKAGDETGDRGTETSDHDSE